MNRLWRINTNCVSHPGELFYEMVHIALRSHTKLRVLTPCRYATDSVVGRIIVI